MKKPQKTYPNYLKFSGMAFQMLASIALAMWAGFSLDSYLNMPFPIFAALFSVLAVVGLIIMIIRSMPKY